MDTAALIAKYDRPVPRHTSYPTAPHFSAVVGASDCADWLRALPDDAALSLYLHVPFRAGLCRFHTDSTTKIVTVLIDLNQDWSNDGGRLRLLRGPDDIEDITAEVPPIAGMLLTFRRTDNSWHGHKPFEGVRRSIMLNWMTSPATMRRHALSAGVKSLFGRGTVS